MNMPEKIHTDGYNTTEALALFDSLEAVDTDFMIGKWKGEGFHTQHRLDGILETYHWHGKQFDDPEHVHPLIFSTLRGKQTYINPIFMGPSLSLPLPRSAVFGRFFQLLMPLISTSRHRAKLRMVDYRGKASATMVYDQLPIKDIFAKLDDNTVLGLMDFKNGGTPFFFILRREIADPQ